ncbi:hypothetical protein HRbin36_01323 [bacterium HR36]|nr:hypothetical protein HRbin36_01323 [bacterium HR36]
MTSDEKVQLAEKIARELRDVSYNEWQKWVNYFAHNYDLPRALQLARLLANSIWVRPDPKKAASSIASVIGKWYDNQLSKIKPEELEEVFGYVGRCLKVAEFERKSASRPEPRPGRPPGRGGRQR